MRNPLIVLLALLLLGQPLGAQVLEVASDEQDLWVALSSPPRKLMLLHRHRDDPPFQWQQAAELVGRLTPGGLATAGRRAWMVFSDHTVQSVGVVRESLPPAVLPYQPPRTERGLPEGVSLRSLAAGADGPWALMQITDVAKLKQSLTPADAELDFDSTAAAPRDVLLRLGRRAWNTVNLPEDWPHGQRSWLLMRRSTDSTPLLLAQRGGEGLVIYEQEGTAPTDLPDAPRQRLVWRHQAYRFDLAADQPLAVTTVQSQVIVAQPIPTTPTEDGQGQTGHLVVQVRWLGGGRVTELGELVVEGDTGQAWGLGASGTFIALLTESAGHRISAIRMSLTGEVQAPSMPMAVRTGPRLADDARRLVLTTTMAVSMLLLLAAWRREPRTAKPTLPPDMAIADLPRRLAAAAIDFIPAALVACLVHNIRLAELAQHWPGVAMGWREMNPGLTAIGLHVAHCLFAEWRWGRSLGKMMLGLQVIQFDGRPATPATVLVRNVLRALDMIAWYVLPLLLIVSPHKQRLGDLLARTIVVAPQTEEDEPDDSAE